MYQAYWGLDRSPFTAAASRQALLASPVHAEALARLDYVWTARGRLAWLVGPAGCGKSAVLVEFAERAGRQGACVVGASAASADEVHLLAPLADGLSVDMSGESWRIWRRLVDRLEEIRLDGLAVVLLLDDLDRAHPGGVALAERLLALPAAPLTIVASAQPAALRRLPAPLLDQAALRIDLSPWTESETSAYVRDTLAAAGRRQPAFDEGAVRRLFELSAGAPRRINQLAELALIAGAGQQQARIDASTVEAVRNELCVM